MTITWRERLAFGLIVAESVLVEIIRPFVLFWRWLFGFSAARRHASTRKHATGGLRAGDACRGEGGRLSRLRVVWDVPGLYGRIVVEGVEVGIDGDGERVEGGRETAKDGVLFVGEVGVEDGGVKSFGEAFDVCTGEAEVDDAV